MDDQLFKAVKALKAADAAGDTEAAKSIASSIKKLQAKSKSTSYKTKAVNALSFSNKAIAETLGAPVDLVTAGINFIPGVDIEQPLFGNESIKKGMKWLGIPVSEREPETTAENVGQAIGEVAGFLVPSTSAVKALSKGKGVASRVAKSVWSSIKNHPYVTMLSEISGGVGTGLTRKAVEDVESPGLRTSAEIAGGAVGSLVPSAALYTPAALLAKGGRTLLRKISVPFSKSGSKYRAGEFIKSQVADPEKTIAAIGADSVAELPPAIKSGERRLAGLYRELTEADPVSEANAVERISKQIVSLEKEMRRLGYGSPEVLAEVTSRRVTALELKMDQRVAKAMTDAQTKLESIPVAERKVAESRIVRRELEAAMMKDKAEERALWANVDKSARVEVAQTKESYAAMYDDLSRAQRSDIPPQLKNSPIIKSEKMKETTLNEMQGLRSKLLESARLARKNSQWNRARIAEDMADAILADIGIAAEGELTPDASNLKVALSATKKFKTTYESGITGKVLGYSKTGAPAIDPDLTLEMSIGRMGDKGSIDISKIVVSPEAMNATKKYLSRSFTDYALKAGKLDPVKAERWVRSNEAILDQFPELRSQMKDATVAQEFATKTKQVMDARKAALRNPKISYAARFLNSADLGSEIKTVLKSGPEMAENLVSMASKDPSGNALAGLRGGFVEDILERSSIGSPNQLGEQTLSGSALLHYLKQNNNVLSKVFTKEQLNRMELIGTDLAKLEAIEKARPVEVQLTDAASTALRTFARIVGARLGGHAGKSSAGGSLQMAQIGSERMKLFMNWITKNRAEALISDAILSDDPKLLTSLLEPMSKPGAFSPKQASAFNARLNTWLMGEGQRVIKDIIEENQ